MRVSYLIRFVAGKFPLIDQLGRRPSYSQAIWSIAELYPMEFDSYM